MDGEPCREGGALLNDVAREIEDLAAAAHRLQDTLAGIGARLPLSEQATEEIQALDALAQHATELGAVLALIAARAPEGWQIHLPSTLQQVPLAQLAVRLGSTRDLTAEQVAAAGELELL